MEKPALKQPEPKRRPLSDRLGLVLINLPWLLLLLIWWLAV
ncbi:hypothetical protein QWZ03_14670 [Chitinimonas viridis]|uniref:Uncharacterized protein n=1 Tax=Chitinimonas viridis TaxID=664880 RepID=A0ABT8B7L3_9NEIS|nr:MULTISPECIES: hypothetical protein [Chitinimonas]MDN3578010.1 hypothetical protein [Chitinimonas viridis]